MSAHADIARVKETLFGANPEFLRNLWLEFGIYRVVLMPLVLGAVFFLAHLADEMGGGNTLAKTAHFMFVLVVLIWGTRMAADGVIQEINARTWDGQRMSAIGPWSMSWGKLFGSTAFVWLGGLICIAVYVAAVWNFRPLRDMAVDIGMWVTAAILAHAVSLLVSIVAIQKGRTPGRLQVTLFQGLGLLAGIAAIAPYWSGWRAITTFSWFGWETHPREFLLFSFMAFAAWAVAGLYFMMRRELQLLNSPLPWLAFVLFCLVYAFGLGVGAEMPFVRDRGISGFPAYWLTMSCGFGLVYIIAFCEPKNAVSLRQLAAYVGQGDFAKAVYFVPRTTVTLAVAIIMGVWMMAGGYADFHSVVYRGSGNTFMIAALLFLIRDAALIFYATAGRTSARADYVALTYLFLLYFLVPGIFAALDWEPVLSVFWAVPGRGAYATIAPPLVEAIVIGALLYFRVRKVLEQKV